MEKEKIFSELKKYVYAHRGYHNKPDIPENSLPAFRRAIERGWGAELDVHLIKDGSLVVFHDSDIKRCTGEEGIIEDMTLDEVKALRLEGTDERIPTFDEVLELFENTSPLIIELKAYRGNHAGLTEAVCRRLDSYKGLYCIESFDPRVIMDYRRMRPDTVRGQLSCDFRKEPDVDVRNWQRPVLTAMLFNIFSKPDFVAFKYEDMGCCGFKRAVRHGAVPVAWTIRNKDAFDDCLSRGMIPIFEKFDPEKEQEAGK